MEDPLIARLMPLRSSVARAMGVSFGRSEPNKTTTKTMPLAFLGRTEDAHCLHPHAAMGVLTQGTSLVSLGCQKSGHSISSGRNDQSGAQQVLVCSNETWFLLCCCSSRRRRLALAPVCGQKHGNCVSGSNASVFVHGQEHGNVIFGKRNQSQPSHQLRLVLTKCLSASWLQ